jgi:MinD superfamily P-loop ATPase
MREVVVLSGKGGTGKTSLVAGLAELIRAERELPIRVGFVDVDVDAANLELVFSPRLIREELFFGGGAAVIDQALCLGCGRCQEVCRFGAVGNEQGGFLVEPLLCEGCGACVHQCPEGAIKLKQQQAGKWMRSSLGDEALFHADLLPGRENSGKLVARVREQARSYAQDLGLDLLLVDGPPGTGCPVHSAVTGADLVLIVTEPTAAGLQDLERVLGTAAHFEVPSQVCLNKVDLYPEAAEQIEAVCRSRGAAVIGRVPFDRRVPEAMVQGTNLIAYAPDSETARAIAEIWDNIKGLFELEGPLEGPEQVEPGSADGVTPS